MRESHSAVVLQIGASQADEVELDRLTTQLRDDLLQLDVEDVKRPRATDIPAGARSAGAAEIGTLLLTVIPTPMLVSGLINKLRGWLARDPRRTVKLSIGGDSIEMTNVTSEEAARFAAVLLQKHDRTDPSAS